MPHSSGRIRINCNWDRKRTKINLTLFSKVVISNHNDDWYMLPVVRLLANGLILRPKPASYSEIRRFRSESSLCVVEWFAVDHCLSPFLSLFTGPSVMAVHDQRLHRFQYSSIALTFVKVYSDFRLLVCLSEGIDRWFQWLDYQASDTVHCNWIRVELCKGECVGRQSFRPAVCLQC